MDSGPVQLTAAEVANALQEGGDAELIRRARKGEELAREELARRCRRSAYVLAVQLLRRPEDAHDIAQDAVMRFFAHLPRFRSQASIEPWLYAIVRNRVRDLVRRKRVRTTEPLEGPAGDLRVDVIDTCPSPEADTARRQLQAQLWRALSALEPTHREILVLRDYQDMTYDDIARTLHIPLGTVMSRLHRARKAAGEAFREERRRSQAP